MASREGKGYIYYGGWFRGFSKIMDCLRENAHRLKRARGLSIKRAKPSPQGEIFSEASRRVSYRIFDIRRDSYRRGDRFLYYNLISVKSYDLFKGIKEKTAYNNK